jgi:hypothetical protein
MRAQRTANEPTWSHAYSARPGKNGEVDPTIFPVVSDMHLSA